MQLANNTQAKHLEIVLMASSTDCQYPCRQQFTVYVLNDFIPNATKNSKLLLVRPLCCRRAVEAPMEELVGPWKYRASLPSIVTNCYDVGNVLSQERDNVLRLLA